MWQPEGFKKENKLSAEACISVQHVSLLSDDTAAVVLRLNTVNIEHIMPLNVWPDASRHHDTLPSAQTESPALTEGVNL